MTVILRTRMAALLQALAAVAFVVLAGGCSGDPASIPDPVETPGPGPGDPPPSPAPLPDPDPDPGPDGGGGGGGARSFDFSGAWTLTADVSFNSKDPEMVGEVKTIPCEFTQRGATIGGSCDLAEQRVTSTGSANGSRFSISLRLDAMTVFRAEGAAVGGDGIAGRLTGSSLGLKVFQADFTGVR